VIDLLLTTDLLSEGVNLQDAEVVVHLDIPWTLARMEQRVGRVARMGSRHGRVHVHVLHPPRSAAVGLGNEMIVRRKWTIARASVGTSASNPLPESIRAENVIFAPNRSSFANGSVSDALTESIPAKTERLRSILQSWVTCDDVDGDELLVATVRSTQSGFVAGVLLDDRPHLLVGLEHEVSTDLDDQITACLSTSSDEIPTDAVDSERALRALQSWCTRERASAAAGMGESSMVRRRQITSRIDLAIQSAPPHLRSSRSVVAARARRVATTQQCAAVEHELDSLLHSDLPADEWLDAVAALGSSSSELREANHSTGSVRIQALLLTRAP
jgi:hypothetical protein